MKIKTRNRILYSGSILLLVVALLFASKFLAEKEDAFPIKIQEIYVPGMSNNKLDFFIDIQNCTSETKIVSVEYCIELLNADRSIVPTKDNKDSVIYRAYYKDGLYLDSDDTVFKYGFTSDTYYNKDDIERCTNVKIWPQKAVDANGKEYFGTEDLSVTAAFYGKREYSFSKNKTITNDDLAKIISKFTELCSSDGITLGEYEYFERDGKYCVLRYSNLDIKIMLDEMNVPTGSVYFAYYYPPAELNLDDLNPEKELQANLHIVKPYIINLAPMLTSQDNINANNLEDAIKKIKVVDNKVSAGIIDNSNTSLFGHIGLVQGKDEKPLIAVCWGINSSDDVVNQLIVFREKKS